MAAQPRAILFDLDRTLVDGSGVRAAVARTCDTIASTRPGLDANQLLASNRIAWPAYWPTVEKQWTLGALDGAAVSLEGWRRTLLGCGVKDEALARLALETHVGYTREAYRLFDDARDALRVLTGRLPLALITNGAADTQRDKLRSTNIESLFDAVLVSGELGVAKPDPLIFQMALDQLNVAPEGAWHIGDSLSADVAGARAAGVTAVWLNRSSAERHAGDPMPDIEISALSQLESMLNPG